jgi:hypothetical protein
MIKKEDLPENMAEAKTSHAKAVEAYQKYVGAAKTEEERLRRINTFRSGGI